MKQKSKHNKNHKEYLDKVTLFYELKDQYLIIRNTIIGTMVAIGNDQFKNDMSEFITSSTHEYGAKQFNQKLHEYSNFLKKKCKNYLPDTTAWNRRYLKQFINSSPKDIPGFEKFYFQGLDKQAVILLLRTLQLAIAQEELIIQQEIINEK